MLTLPSDAKRFLVTGGAGFIGSHVVDTLLNAGAARVVVVDDFNDYYDPRLKWQNVDRHLQSPAFHLEVADIRDRDRLCRIARAERDGFDCVIHLAARAGVRPSLPEARLYNEVNIGGTLNLLELARDHQWRRFIFASSSSVYGPTAVAPFHEDAALMPVSPYAATKAAGELMVHAFAHLYTMQAMCLRFFTVYGPRQRPDLAIHKFASAIAARKPIPVYGEGSTLRDYTYIDDIVQGIVGAVHHVSHGVTPFEVVNLGGSHCISLSQLISMLERSLGQRALIDRQPEQPGDLPLTHADIGKAQRLLGYSPSTTIEAGIAKFVKWLRRGDQAVAA